MYRKGNVTFTPDGNSIISPVGNRITIFDLKKYKINPLCQIKHKIMMHVAMHVKLPDIISHKMNLPPLICEVLSSENISDASITAVNTQCVECIV